MKKLLLINACIRKNESRTRALTDAIVPVLGERYEIEEIDLTETALLPLDHSRYNARSAGVPDALGAEYARKVAEADRIVFAAPFWDMSFPAIVKVFCENVSLYDITFTANPDGSTRGLCRAEKMLLITTRGMEIADGSTLEQGSPYLKAVGWLWGIPKLEIISAQGMDMCSAEECTKRLDAAAKQGRILCETF